MYKKTTKGFLVNEIKCKSVINKSRIPGIDFTINPYLGCQHGCVYCYARFMTKYTNHNKSWGRFVNVKINSPEIVKKQIKKIKGGLISISSVTDPYQPAEKKYQLTRSILKELVKHNVTISILTKSGLVSRDIDILKKFKPENCVVGFSINTYSEKTRERFEPGASTIKDRIKSLRKLHLNGIRTWVFLAPILPKHSAKTIPKLLFEIKDSVDYVLVDKLNIKCGNWETISKTLFKYYPNYFSKWKKILFSKTRKKIYYQNAYHYIYNLCSKYNISTKFVP